MQPDFDNLRSQWAAVTPTGVALAEYSATMQTTPPECPAYTEGGWTVDAKAPLPTIGAEGVTPGMPSGVPTGSITVSVNTSIATSNPAASTSHTYVSTDNPSTTNEAEASATSEGAAGKTASNIMFSGDVGLVGMVVALIAVGAGMMILL